MSTSGPNLSVMPAEVTELGRFVYKLADELRTGAVALDREVVALLSTWKGAAADSYDAGWDEMHSGAMKVWEELFELAAKLGVTADTYRDQDDTTQVSISSLDLP